MGTGSRPLEGIRVVVTRAREQAAALVAALEARGAHVLVHPMIRIDPPEDPMPLRRAAARVAEYDWVVFTSANGVHRFMQELRDVGGDRRSFARVRVACVGPSTAAALAAYGIEADLVPEAFVGESVVDAVVRRGTDGARDGIPATKESELPLAGSRILLPVAAGARPVIAEGLAKHGAEVERVEAYRTVPAAEDAEVLRRRLDAGGVDVVTFTSSSTVESFVGAIGTRLGGAVAAAIGPVTAQVARRLGLEVAIEAEEYTAVGLVDALVRHLGPERGRARGV